MLEAMVSVRSFQPAGFAGVLGVWSSVIDANGCPVARRGETVGVEPAPAGSLVSPIGEEAPRGDRDFQETAVVFSRVV
jgi:hypothetical protein